MMGQELFNTFILILLVVAALSALRIRDLLSSAVVFGVYSFLMCLLWAEMGAVDVAFTEATVGAAHRACGCVASSSGGCPTDPPVSCTITALRTSSLSGPSTRASPRTSLATGTRAAR